MASKIGLSVRQHEREEIQLPVEFTVCNEHREQVRFSSSSFAGRPHVIQGKVTDISRGGLGIACQLFLPRMCEGKVRIFNGIFNGTGTFIQGDTSPASKPILEVRVKVRRVLHQGHDSTYQIGLAFVESPENIEELILNVFHASDEFLEQNALPEGDVDA